MLFAFHGALLDIDAEGTRRFYEGLPPLTESCACPGCRNYRQAVPRFPAAVSRFFHALGVDPEKAAEIVTWCAADDGRSVYCGGFYHLRGRILQENGDGPFDFREISDGWSAAFTEEISLPEAGLGAPALQLEIDFQKVPWTLEEENPYI